MAKERISMRKIKEILRLYFEVKLSHRQIAVINHIGRTTAQEYILRFKTSSLLWPLAASVTEENWKINIPHK